MNLFEEGEAKEAKVDGANQYLVEIRVIADELRGDKVEHRQRCTYR